MAPPSEEKQSIPSEGRLESASNLTERRQKVLLEGSKKLGRVLTEVARRYCSL